MFGNKEEFKNLFYNLKKINFPLEIISKYYLYEAERWDLETNQKKIIKLPSKNYIKSLKNFMILRKDNNFEKYRIFDYRLNKQLILK